MGLEQKISATKKNWKKFGMKALLGGIVLLASPFLTFKVYEGKPWHFLFLGSTNTSVSGRYVMQRYCSIWGKYGLKKFRYYRDFDEDGSVDQVMFSTDYPLWLKDTLLSKLLPKEESGDLLTDRVWLRGAVAEKFTKRYFMPPRMCYSKENPPPEPPIDKVPPKQNETNLRIYQTSEEVEKSGAKPLFDEADKLFKKWYGKKPTMPHEPGPDERWFLYRQDD